MCRKPDALGSMVAGNATDMPSTTAPRNTPNLVLTAYHRYDRAPYGHIDRIVSTSHDSEDILQETFTRALVSCHTRPGGDDHEALVYCRRWLFHVATNLCVDRLRRRKRQPASLDPAGEGTPEGGGVWQPVTCTGLA